MRSGFIFPTPDKENQWLDPGQVAEPVAKRDRFSRKAMLCVWWNFEGIIHFELVPNNRAIDAELYSTQLERMHTALAKKYPALVNRKRVLLQQDNASPHTARRTKEKIRELKSIELLPHPAYSPDLAPSDFHLFRSMAHFLRGRSFGNLDEIETGCREFFASHDKAWYRRGTEQLAERWVRTIEHDGLYFDEQSLSVFKLFLFKILNKSERELMGHPSITSTWVTCVSVYKLF